MTETLYAKDFESFSLPLNQLDPMSDSNDSFPMSPFTQSPPSGYSSELINSPEELFGAQPYLEQPPQQTQQLETKVFVVQQQTTQQAPNFLTASSQQTTQQPYTTTTTTNFVFQSQTKLPTLPLLQNQQPQQQQQQSQTQTPPKPTFIVLPELPQLQHSVPAGSSPEQSPQNLPLTSQIQKHKKIKKRKHDETSPVSDGHVGVSSTFPSSTPITESNFKELSAQQMLELDSNQIEDYIRILSNRKNVTATEDKELKKIRRLIKNREYAQSSRDKKKQHMDEVESRMNDAMSEMKDLKDENVVLKRNMNLVADAAQRDPELANRLRILAPTLDLSCGGFSKSMNNSSSSSSGYHVYSVPDISSFVPQAGAINLPHQNNLPSISASNSSTTKSKGATGKSSSNASKRVKTSVGVVSLFVVALAFGMFVNNLSSLPPRASIVNSGASNWRTGRVILSVEKWYHSYAPTFMHPYLDTLFTLFDNDIDEHSNEFHSTTTTSTSAKLSTQESRTINNNNGQHNTISTSNNVGSGNEPSNRLRVESDGVVEAKNNAAASRGDL